MDENEQAVPVEAEEVAVSEGETVEASENAEASGDDTETVPAE